MPGLIRVSVLEVVDLPEVFTDGATVKGVTAKVTLGPTLFKTQPGFADGGRIETWNSDFVFPVMNLRDKLIVSICDSDDFSVTQTAIDIPSIIQIGCRDEFVLLNRGGRVHLKMSFVLSDEERKIVETMRVTALKRREKVERLTKTVIIQPVQELLEIELKKSPVVTETIATVDVPTTYDKNDSKEKPNWSKGVDSTPKSPAPKRTPEPDHKPSSKLVMKPMFNYAKAIGVQSETENIERRTIRCVPDKMINGVMASIGDVDCRIQRVRDVGEFDGVTKADASSAASPGSTIGICALLTKSVDCNPQLNSAPPGGPVCLMNEAKSYYVKNVGGNGLSGNALAHVPLVSSAISDESLSSPAPAARDCAPMAVDMSYEVEANIRGRFFEARTGRDTVEISVSSVDSTSNMSLVDTALMNELEAGPLAKTSVGGISNRTGLPTNIPCSASSTLTTVKARVKGTFFKVSLRRRFNPASSSTVVVRTQPPLSVACLQDWFRRVLSNGKGCFCAPPAKRIHHLQHQ